MALEKQKKVLPSIRSRGRPRLSDDERRQHAITSRFSRCELGKVDQLRGKMSRGEWLRTAALGSAPAIIPQLNISAWRELSRASANLNQLTRLSHLSGRLMDDRVILAKFRAALIGAKWGDVES